jgi:hypothetical protein
MSKEETEESELDIEALNDVYGDKLELWEAIDYELDSWLNRHPTFAEEFGFVDEGEGRPRIFSRRFADVFTGMTPEIQSEWAFLVAFGYKEGIAEYSAELHERTSLSQENHESDE